MKLYNTLSRSLEEFKPINNKTVLMYSCGPTVYDTAHIGNLRTYIFNDLLKRTFISAGFVVQQVMNITDIDDKTIFKSDGDPEKFKELTKKHEEEFWRDLSKLNILSPEIIAHATEYVDKMVDFIIDLMDKDFAYKGEDGSIYFSIEKFADYGKLAKLDKSGLKIGARVNSDEYSKENPADFALWKAWDESDGRIFWETKLGKGRPGWHIECSTMANSELGDTIDIHTGGVDNIFPHHENEIAQSESRTGKKFANFWIHGEHLLVNGKKMAKSERNFYNLKDLVEKGFAPLDFRYFVVGAHYRSKLNFTWQGIESARNSRQRLLRIIQEISVDYSKSEPNGQYLAAFKNSIDNDLDTPSALAVLWQMLRDNQVKNNQKYATILEMDKIFGLSLGQAEKIEAPQDIIELAEKREKARQSEDYALSDTLRSELGAKGWVVEDLASGYKLEKNSF